MTSRILLPAVALFKSVWDANFAVPHQIEKIVHALLLAISDATWKDICAWSHTDVFRDAPEVPRRYGFESAISDEAAVNVNGGLGRVFLDSFLPLWHQYKEWGKWLG